MQDNRNEGQKSWTFRRRIVISALLFCAATVATSILKTDLAEGVATTALSSAFTLAGAVIGSYVFGAVWNDKR